MILSTREQAINFAMYALENDPLFSGLNEHAMLGHLKHSIRLVFGGHTFEHGDLESIAQSAMDLLEYN